jgi:hypothetical protein
LSSIAVCVRSGRNARITPSAATTPAIDLGAITAIIPDFEGPADDEPIMEFQVADPDELRRRLTNAGLKNVTVHTDQEERIEVHSGRQLWDWTIGSNPIPGTLVASLTEDQRNDVIKVLSRMVRELAGGNGSAVLTAPLNIGVGTK